MASNRDWDRAETAVDGHADELRAMTTHTELYAWATDNKLATKTLWPKVKHVMKTRLGIDYNAMREAALTAQAADVAAAAADAPVVELWTAGDAEVSTFAVCDETGEQAWYGEFGEHDRMFTGDDLSAEHAAADKAVFLAGKVREDAGLDTIQLVIHACHPDVDAAALAGTAGRHRVAVTVDVDDQNPAVALCRAPGSRAWREVDLAVLLPAAQEATA